MSTAASILLTMGSQVQPFNSAPPSPFPTSISVDGTPVAVGTARSGFLLALFDPSTTISATSPYLCQLYTVEPDDDGQWYDTYSLMYSKLWLDLTTQMDPTSSLLLLASFGLDANMVPPVDFIQYLFELGAGSGLQDWASGANAGSRGPSWVGQPIIYGLATYAGSGFANGKELYLGHIPTISGSLPFSAPQPSST
jgi:hypothetical protein